MPQNNPPAAKFIAKLCIAVLGWVKNPQLRVFSSNQMETLKNRKNGFFIHLQE
jgi:hypothetical protein